MQKLLLGLIFSLFSFSAIAQIEFEPGYFISENGERKEVLIKNEGWNNNPTHFQYKSSRNSKTETIDIDSLKEFGINGKFKFVVETVQIDGSRGKIHSYENHPNPKFTEEKVLLEVLVEGGATLYVYEAENVNYFFYKKGDKIEPLIYKKYFYESSSGVGNQRNSKTVRENVQYKQQLLNHLKCESISRKDIEQLNYKEDDLVDFFVAYNRCADPDFVFEDTRKKTELNLSVKPGINFASLSVENSANDLAIDFGTKTTFRIGLEAELVLPFNEGKWAAIFEPTYRVFKDTKRVEDENTPYYHDYDFNLKLLELPIGVRYYMFLSKESKLFTNILFSVNLDFGSDVKKITHYTNSTTSSEELDVTTSSFKGALGLGYDYGKYSLEVRYNAPVNNFSSYASLSSEYGGFSLILGYTIL